MQLTMHSVSGHYTDVNVKRYLCAIKSKRIESDARGKDDLGRREAEVVSF